MIYRNVDIPRLALESEHFAGVTKAIKGALNPDDGVVTVRSDADEDFRGLVSAAQSAARAIDVKNINLKFNGFELRIVADEDITSAEEQLVTQACSREDRSRLSDEVVWKKFSDAAGTACAVAKALDQTITFEFAGVQYDAGPATRLQDLWRDNDDAARFGES